MAPDVDPVVKTYRYLRLSIIGMFVLLLCSVGWETMRSGSGCWLTSISSYYYTPVRQIFVATLITVGVCMLVIRGSTSGENLALNLAGILCPVVALVPTPDTGGCPELSVRSSTESAVITNNIAALLAAGIVGLVAAVTITSAGGLRRRPVSPLDLVGLAMAFVALVGFGAWFTWDRPGFINMGHNVAASVMLMSIIAVVALNMHDLAWERALGQGRHATWRDYVNRYLAVLLLMVGGVIAVGALWFFVPWDHAVLWLEGVLAVMFGTFWTVQAHELWNRGARVLYTDPPIGSDSTHRAEP